MPFGLAFSPEERDGVEPEVVPKPEELWDKYSTDAPARRQWCIGRSNLVKSLVTLVERYDINPKTTWTSAEYPFRQWSTMEADSMSAALSNIKAARVLKRSGLGAAILVALLFAYQATLAFPQPFFPHRVTYKHMTIYSRRELPRDIETILQKTDSLLSRSELYNPQTESRIFICDSNSLFWFYTGGLRHVFAVAFPHTTRYIFVPKADYERDLVLFERTGPGDKRERHLTSTLAHEIVHLYIFDCLGRKAEAALPDWIKEGYCEYIGQGDAIPPDEGIKHLLNGDGNIPGLFYFRSRRMMEVLMDSQGSSIQQVLSHPPNEAEVLEALMKTMKLNQTLH